MKPQLLTQGKKSLKTAALWAVRSRHIPLDRPLVMGVINLTPDSFSDGGQFTEVKPALDHALRLIDEGADILDLGAESTRPGALPVSAEEECRRLLPVLETILSKVQVPISIDTTKPQVAQACLELGAHIINDVSGLKDSGQPMAEIVAQHRAGVVLMHRRGNPQTMHLYTDYGNVMQDVIRELEESVRLAVGLGIARDQMAVDPGLGFSKTPAQNIELMRTLERLAVLELPVVLGPSRKSFLGQLTKRDVHEREFATAACVAAAVFKGCHILRVHNVRMMKDVVDVAFEIGKAG